MFLLFVTVVIKWFCHVFFVPLFLLISIWFHQILLHKFFQRGHVRQLTLMSNITSGADFCRTPSSLEPIFFLVHVFHDLVQKRFPEPWYVVLFFKHYFGGWFLRSFLLSFHVLFQTCFDQAFYRFLRAEVFWHCQRLGPFLVFIIIRN